MARKDYAADFLELMNESDRSDFIELHGASEFVRLWRAAHSEQPGGVPPLSADFKLGRNIMRRNNFDDLGQMAQHTFIQGGGVVVD